MQPNCGATLYLTTEGRLGGAEGADVAWGCRFRLRLLVCGDSVTRLGKRNGPL